MQQEINPLDPVPDPKPLPKPTRVALIWDGKQFAEIDPLTGECLTVGEVEEFSQERGTDEAAQAE